MNNCFQLRRQLRTLAVIMYIHLLMCIPLLMYIHLLMCIPICLMYYSTVELKLTIIHSRHHHYNCCLPSTLSFKCKHNNEKSGDLALLILMPGFNHMYSGIPRDASGIMLLQIFQSKRLTEEQQKPLQERGK